MATPAQEVESSPIILSGHGLTIEQTVAVARQIRKARMTEDPIILKRMDESCAYIATAVRNSIPLYGVTTLFGGMAHRQISNTEASELQNNLVYNLKTGAGAKMPLEDVRAAMLLRANSHLIGVSGIRREITARLLAFLDAGITPFIPEFGSVGASGDLVPLAYIVGSICGMDVSFQVDVRGTQMSAPDALKLIGLTPERLQPKEGLAMVNGTSMMAATASLAVYDLYTLFAGVLHAHALAIQALHGQNQPFHPFLHEMKPHFGQKYVAGAMLTLLEESKLVNDTLDGSCQIAPHTLIQDRYSMRAIPQYLGPVVEAMHGIARTIEIEMNSANDNPLIDVDAQKAYAGANFFGEHVSTSMDRLRYIIGLTSKHLDVQIAQAVTAQFSNGLPDCLIGNSAREVNMGVKGLQLCGNSIMPYLLFMGASIADKFASHAEQYNQNINSMGFVSANLARQSIAAMRQHVAIALLIFVQAVDLRAKIVHDIYDPRELLSPNTRVTYEAVRELVHVPVSDSKPYIWNDNEQALDGHIAIVANSLTDDKSGLCRALNSTREQLFKDRHILN